MKCCARSDDKCGSAHFVESVQNKLLLYCLSALKKVWCITHLQPEYYTDRLSWWSKYPSMK